MRQKTLFKLKYFSSEFGGSLLQSRRKAARPTSLKNPMKVVLKADSINSPKLSRHRHNIERAFKKFSEQFQVKLYEVAVCGDHVHFVALFQKPLSYTQFIRALTGTLARQFKIKFKFRPWSRILAWGRSLRIAIQYTQQNHLETIGSIPYQPRSKDLRRSKMLIRQADKNRPAGAMGELV